ncbi:MAG TPA: S-layer homology domain-containing protein, partial [Chloroflexia bacterium]|nr:S-layer homology domain-containing protein [Chloroflexia bacterium]
VAGNKLYILGGFQIGALGLNTIYQFDPNAAAGSRWTLKNATLPVALAYVPAATIGGLIYTGGGSTVAAGALTDSTNSYVYNPTSDTISALANQIPRATGETRAVVVAGEMWVLGGGRTAPNPSNEVDIYNVGTGTWRVGLPFTAARRNFPADSDGTHVWLVGGYEPTTPAVDMQIYNPVVTCGTPSPTPTITPGTPTPAPSNTATNTPVNTATNTPVNTATNTPVNTATNTATNTPVNTATPTSGIGPTNTPPATNTRTATATAGLPPTNTATPPASATRTAAPTNTAGPSATPCPLSFIDVHPTDYFYTPVLYLACHGVISGYTNGDGTYSFRPYNNTTRSQMVKIVVLGFQKPIVTPAGGGHTFADVPPSNPFFSVIETAAADTIVSGYNCGGPSEPCDNLNRPYFRPYANVTRGQLSKIDVVAAGWAVIDPPIPTFADVFPGTAFYTFVETAYCHGIISGYNCGGIGEPCDNQNRPYFRQYNNATRGQIAKIVYLSITAGGSCNLGTPTPGPSGFGH